MFVLAREYRSLTQRELAANLGVQQGTVSKIEAGLLVPTDETVQKYVEAVGFPKEFFYQTDRVCGFGLSAFCHFW